MINTWKRDYIHDARYDMELMRRSGRKLVDQAYHDMMIYGTGVIEAKLV